MVFVFKFFMKIKQIIDIIMLKKMALFACINFRQILSGQIIYVVHIYIFYNLVV